MSLRTETPLGDINSKARVACKSAVRQAYMEVITYLCSISSHFTIDKLVVAELDSKRNWPESFDKDRYGQPSYTYNVLSYKNVKLGLFLDTIGNMYFKFPTVSHKLRKISRYTRRSWDYANQGRMYSRHEDPEMFELTAFKAGRLPTKEEVLQLSFVQTDTKNENHTFCIHLEMVVFNIVDEVEAKYKKYVNSAKKVTTSMETSAESVYKLYIKVRGNAAFERWKAKQPTPNIVTLPAKPLTREEETRNYIAQLNTLRTPK